MIRRIREWMFKNNYSSDTLFELLVNRTGRHLEKTLTRLDFHKGLASTEIGLGAPDVDALFNLLDINDDGVVDLREWKNRIYEDSVNPLQLFKMKLRVWDAPLDFNQFGEALRRLDPTLSEP